MSEEASAQAAAAASAAIRMIEGQHDPFQQKYLTVFRLVEGGDYAQALKLAPELVEEAHMVA